jgi:hypothetical protein
MIICATRKLLNVSGIKPVKNNSSVPTGFPGEWYAGILSTGRPGKLVNHFFHVPTLLSILIPGKSLNKTVPEISRSLMSLLKRNGFGQLFFQFQVNTEPEIYSTNSKSILGYMNQLTYNLEYHLYHAFSYEEIDYERIEDIHLNYLFGVKGKSNHFIRPIEILKDHLKKNNS